MTILKRVAAQLPIRWQTELKRVHFGRQITHGTFSTSEPEYKLLPELISPGDWVIDIGANVGHYTKRLSELVGARGRVIAFEPVPTTFALLAANVQLFAHTNVTLINAAVSDHVSVVGMSIPKFEAGLLNYYEAHLATNEDVGNGDAGLSVLTLPLDTLCIEQRISLIKIDAEGHEAPVLAGMKQLLLKHHPILIVETGAKPVIEHVKALGYVTDEQPNSPNMLFRPVH